LCIERFGAHDAQGRRHVIRTATVTAVRGYERADSRLRAGLEAAGLHPATQPLLLAVTSRLGAPGPGPAPGPGVELEREMPASVALALVLGRLRGHVLANQEGVLLRLDTEFLHEFRVAIRRSRSMVKLGRSSLDRRAVRLSDELAWLGAVTSPVRDLDVHIEELGEGSEDDLGPVRDLLAARRDAAQPTLAAVIRSRRYKALLSEWGRIADPSATRPRGAGMPPDGTRPIGEVADGYLWKAYRRVVRGGREISDASPAEMLHDLRKRAKELRYLLECFQTLYPDEELRAVVRELKLLQDNLGEFQDCQVQADTLRALGEEIMAGRRAPAVTLMAMGRLADEQERRERKSRIDFAARFDRFACRDNRKRFESMVSETTTGTGPDDGEAAG